MYVYGSATMRGLKPSSDLDLLAVRTRPTTGPEKRALANRLQPISREGERPKEWRPLELTILAEPDIQPWRHPAVRDFQYGEWLRGALDEGTAMLGPTRDADVALLIAMARQSGLPIVGPAPSAVLPNVPRVDVFAALQKTVEDVKPGLRTIPVFALLTLAWVWFTLHGGGFASKDDAGKWAAERLGPESRATLLRAADSYISGTEDEWDVTDPAIAATAASLITAIGTYREVL
jgi:streptomycin 3"-adenylyltransferase